MKNLKQQGSVLVEFTIALPFLVMFIFTTIELSLILIKKSQVDFAVNSSLRKFVYLNFRTVDNSYDRLENMLKQELGVFNLLDDGQLPNGFIPDNLSNIKRCVPPNDVNFEVVFDVEYLELPVSLELNCNICHLVPGLDLNEYKRNFFQAIPLTNGDVFGIEEEFDDGGICAFN